MSIEVFSELVDERLITEFLAELVKISSAEI